MADRHTHGDASAGRAGASGGASAGAYSSYEPSEDAPLQVVGSQTVAVKRIAGALRDAVSAVDELKRAGRVLEHISKAGPGMRSTEMKALFEVASAAVSAAATWAPAVLSREDVMSVFGSKRFLVTRETAGEAAVAVRRAEAWMKEIVRGIGRDLVAAKPDVDLPERKESKRARRRRKEANREKAREAEDRGEERRERYDRSVERGVRRGASSDGEDIRPAF